MRSERQAGSTRRHLTVTRKRHPNLHCIPQGRQSKPKHLGPRTQEFQTLAVVLWSCLPSPSLEPKHEPREPSGSREPDTEQHPGRGEAATSLLLPGPRSSLTHHRRKQLLHAEVLLGERNTSRLIP